MGEGFFREELNQWEWLNENLQLSYRSTPDLNAHVTTHAFISILCERRLHMGNKSSEFMFDDRTTIHNNLMNSLQEQRWKKQTNISYYLRLNKER